jgi:flavin-dependent dehydrogenase
MTAAVDAVVIGGGPAGAAVARLLALWGHSVVVLTKADDSERGAAESLPPSTRKLLATIGVLEAVDSAGFYRSTGNTVWWGRREGHVERFDPAAGGSGYQVLRPEFDRLLLSAAADAGADVQPNGHVRSVDLDEDGGARVTYAANGTPPVTVTCKFALDASGRRGIVARRGFRRHQPGFLTQAFIGEWRRDAGWDLPDPSHTLVETYQQGWAWSVPLSSTVRQVGVAVDGATTRMRRESTLPDTYRAEVARTRQLNELMAGAALGRVWACDASLYSSRQYGGPQFLLIGDAASSIDPLSSFGVKKALASAWVGAVAVHTCITHPDRQAVAIDFFARHEEQVYAANLQRSREFALEAHARHPHLFWAERAQTAATTPPAHLDEEALFRATDVQAEFRHLKESDAIELLWSSAARLTKRPRIDGHEIVLDDAVPLPEAPEGVRFLAGVDLLFLGRMASQHRQVPDLFEAYCRAHGAVPLPSLLGALSVLLAKGVLTPRSR